MGQEFSGVPEQTIYRDVRIDRLHALFQPQPPNVSQGVVLDFVKRIHQSSLGEVFNDIRSLAKRQKPSQLDEVYAQQVIYTMPGMVQEILKSPNTQRKVLFGFPNGFFRYYGDTNAAEGNTLYRNIGKVLLRSLFLENKIEISNEMRDELCDTFNKKIVSRSGNLIFQDLQEVLREQVGTLEEFCQNTGIDVVEFTRDQREDQTTRSWLTMVTLEKASPGICKRLQEKYGINSFFRYSHAFLRYLDSQESWSNGKQKVLVLVASHDRNEALNNPGKFKELLEAYNSGGLQPILFEVSCLEDLQVLMKKHPDAMRDVYQLVVSAHGESNEIKLSERKGSIVIDGIENPVPLTSIRNDQSAIGFTLSINKYLPQLKKVFLHGCSTDKKIWLKDETNVAKTIAGYLREGISVFASPFKTFDALTQVTTLGYEPSGVGKLAYRKIESGLSKR